MIWVTWRQHRAESVVTAVIVVAVAIGLTIIGTVARARANALGLPACLSSQEDCGTRLDALRDSFHSIPPFTGALIALPLLAGMFWAAPLVSREYEAGTHRLAWTQSVSPLRWITTKVVLIFGALAVATAGISLLATWALSPLIPAFGGRFNSTWYDIQGLVPVACMLFALALGVASSALIRRTIPAMAITLTVYALARIPVHWVRAHFAPSATRTIDVPLTQLLQNPLGAPREDFDHAVGSGDWFLNGSVTDPSGQALRATQNNFDILRRYCTDLVASRANGGTVTPSDACRAKLDGLSLHERITYQPANHFWILQSVESAFLLLAAGLLVAVAILAVTRRRPG